MKKIIGLIVLIILGGAGYMIYRANASAIPSDPVLAYQKITGLPAGDQAKAFQKAWTSWVQDPTSIIPYPKGWRKTSITVGKDTFDVITPDTTEPPQYYVSTAFPKKLIKKVTIARCLNLDPKKITDWCVVGDNPQVNAYFKMVEWVKKNSLLNGENLLDGITPKMNIQIPNTH
ncbi:MAG: hypothetical protein WCG20_02865 [bacterium]